MHLDTRKATVGHKAGWAIWDVHADRAHARTLFKTKKAALAEAQAMLDAEREVERREAEARAEVEAARAQKAAARLARLAERAAIQLDRSRQMDLFYLANESPIVDMSKLVAYS